MSLSAQSNREFGDEVAFSLRAGAVPFLFLPWSLVVRRYLTSYRRRDLVLLLAIGTAILLSASRGIVAVSLAFLIVVAMQRLSLLARIAAAFAALIAIYLVFELYLANTLIFSLAEDSNAVKIGHFRSYFDDVTASSATFGRGLASYYYSSGSHALKAQTEISPLDMMRYFGLPLTAALYAFILFPVHGAWRYASAGGVYVLTFALYLVLSVTNPVMFNSYGMLVILWYWSKIRAAERSLPHRRRRTRPS